MKKIFQYFDLDLSPDKKKVIGIKSIDELKRMYKALCIKLHPDKGGLHSDFVAMANEYCQLVEILKNQDSDMETEFTEREMETDFGDILDIIRGLPEMVGCVIEIIGTWIWVSGNNTFPYRKILAEHEFTFSGPNKAWYRPAEGKLASKKRGKLTMQQKRDKYGSKDVEPEKRNYLNELIKESLRKYNE